MAAPSRLLRFLLVGAACHAGGAIADAQDSNSSNPEEAHPFKLTLGSYRFSGGGSGTDINLRHSSALGNLWLGYFDFARDDVRQWRAGWDRTFGDQVRVTPSMQIASHRFVGGSLQVETGDPWFVGAGLGRTNLKPYWNLNFDPNDSYTLSAGHRSADGQTLALQYIRDNRENPDQRHLHVYWRQPMPDRQRLTLDLLRKQGIVDDRMIHRWGASATYDWPAVFLRVAYDPYANFGPDHQWRFSVGTRF